MAYREIALRKPMTVRVEVLMVLDEAVRNGAPARVSPSVAVGL